MVKIPFSLDLPPFRGAEGLDRLLSVMVAYSIGLFFSSRILPVKVDSWACMVRDKSKVATKIHSFITYKGKGMRFGALLILSNRCVKNNYKWHECCPYSFKNDPPNRLLIMR